MLTYWPVALLLFGISLWSLLDFFWLEKRRIRAEERRPEPGFLAEVIPFPQKEKSRS